MTCLIVPGLHGSEPGHWQHWWLEQDAEAVLVEQSSWTRPRLEEWVARLAAAVARHPGAILVAHSLGCLLVAQTVQRHSDLSIGGALLVAPADVGNADYSTELRRFAIDTAAPLPFAATLVASRNDPWMSFEKAAALGTGWGATIVDYGLAGHINVASGFGPWQSGRRLAADLAAGSAPIGLGHAAPPLPHATVSSSAAGA